MKPLAAPRCEVPNQILNELITWKELFLTVNCLNSREKKESDPILNQRLYQSPQ